MTPYDALGRTLGTPRAVSTGDSSQRLRGQSDGLAGHAVGSALVLTVTACVAIVLACLGVAVVAALLYVLGCAFAG